LLHACHHRALREKESSNISISEDGGNSLSDGLSRFRDKVSQMLMGELCWLLLAAVAGE
jgi:hypothetical protein